ncbi:uncharacterized protein [Amphiura filiformis]|uniref:uncharacterized protein n=1 Tax=Amphiura filiformis TaxID=82378 RepID=UPI003B218377
METKLERIWSVLLSGNQGAVSDSAATMATQWWHTGWQRVKDHYSEEVRHYHTLNHIETMFDLLEEYRDRLKSQDAVSWAIFFHDVIYNPQAKDNEEQSAELFKQFAWSCLRDKPNMTQMTYDLIMATKHHVTDAHKIPDSFGKEDVHYFLDFDMQVLGWPDADYDRYAEQIRQEYIHIPHQQYCIGRSKVLSTFLQTTNIFATKDLRDKYEVQARSNIKREIERLQRQIES